jgi:hypothetical protein
MLEEYFAKDEDQGYEKVVFIDDDCDELRELLQEIPNELALYAGDNNQEHIECSAKDIAKISNILYRYTPFLDPLAKHLKELSNTMYPNDTFVTMFQSKPEQILALFDAVCIDLSMYVVRFANESMAMRNIHHIHQPTTLSIQQILLILSPTLGDEGNDLEFF